MNTRRNFLSRCTIASAAALVASGRFPLSSHHRFAIADPPSGDVPWLRKSLKIGMVKLKGGSLQEKFSIAKAAGFEGIELNSGGFDVDEANAASAATGLIIDGTVGGNHWKIRHTDADREVRDQALESLITGIADTAGVGADTILLVPGRGSDGTDEDVYERAVSNIRAALDDAAKHGVSILIENVWNDFLYDHEGGNDQTADRLAAFIDEFDSPWVGVQFDIGNHWKYGDPADWIRTLGKRIKKLDIKGFSRERDTFTQITEGDIDWPSVEQALHDIEFTGWVAAEVGGGDLQHLKKVSRQMEDALSCSKRVAVVN